MAIYPQLHGNIYKEPEEEQERELEEKKSNQELEWKGQIEEEKRAKLMKDRIQKATGKTLPIEREAGEDQDKSEETWGGANALRAQSEKMPMGEMEMPAPQPRSDTVESALAPTTAAKQASAALLKISWLNVITSFGLTLFYIAFHFIGAYVARMSWFCKFGEEWVPLQASNAISADGAGAKANKGLEYAEILTFFISIALYLMLLSLIFFILLAPIFAACKLLNTITFGLIC